MEAFSEVMRPAQLADSSDCEKNTVWFVVVVVLLIVTEKCVSFSSTSGPNYIVWDLREVCFTYFQLTDSSMSYNCRLSPSFLSPSLLSPKVPPPLPSPSLKQPHRA